MLGLVGLKPGASAYCASKGAVVLLTKQIAVEYGADKIHCNALCPGCKSLLYSYDLFFLLLSGEHSCERVGRAFVLTHVLDLKTPMTYPIYQDKAIRDEITAMTPWGEWGLAEDVAKCAVFLASDDAAYVTGLPMTIDGGYTAQ